MRHILSALGFLLATCSVACAAPTTDDEAGATDQASSVDEATALTAEMAKGLTGAPRGPRGISFASNNLRSTAA